MKPTWRTDWLQWLLMAGMFLLAAASWSRVPERLPVHWNFQGHVDRMGGKFEGLLLNGAAYTHTSLALFDALKAVALPCVEVHLSNPEAREAYRQVSRIAPACIAKVSGFGADSYLLALEGLLRWLALRTTR